MTPIAATLSCRLCQIRRVFSEEQSSADRALVLRQRLDALANSKRFGRFSHPVPLVACRNQIVTTDAAVNV